MKNYLWCLVVCLLCGCSTSYDIRSSHQTPPVAGIKRIFIESDLEEVALSFHSSAGAALARAFIAGLISDLGQCGISAQVPSKPDPLELDPTAGLREKQRFAPDAELIITDEGGEKVWIRNPTINLNLLNPSSITSFWRGEVTVSVGIDDLSMESDGRRLATSIVERLKTDDALTCKS